jgi:hypothetical protein
VPAAVAIKSTIGPEFTSLLSSVVTEAKAPQQKGNTFKRQQWRVKWLKPERVVMEEGGQVIYETRQDHILVGACHGCTSSPLPIFLLIRFLGALLNGWYPITT